MPDLPAHRLQPTSEASLAEAGQRSTYDEWQVRATQDLGAEPNFGRSSSGGVAYHLSDESNPEPAPRHRSLCHDHAVGEEFSGESEGLREQGQVVAGASKCPLAQLGSGQRHDLPDYVWRRRQRSTSSGSRPPSRQRLRLDRAEGSHLFPALRSVRAGRQRSDGDVRGRDQRHRQAGGHAPEAQEETLSFLTMRVVAPIVTFCPVFMCSHRDF